MAQNTKLKMTENTELKMTENTEPKMTENTESKYVSIIRDWLNDDEKFLHYLKNIANALDQSNDYFVDDHCSKDEFDTLNSLLTEIVIIQKQFGKVNPKNGNIVWFNCKCSVDEKIPFNAWCCPFPTCSKNPLYLHEEKVHLTRSSMGRNFYKNDYNGPVSSLYNNQREDIQFLGIEKIKILKSFGQEIREYNLLLTINEFKDLINSF